MYKKYELDKSQYIIEPDGVVLYRIRAVRDVVTAEHTIEAGEYGGFVESEANLEQFRNSWIDANSIVRGNARVKGDALVINSTITDNATICDLAMVASSIVSNDAVISGRAIVLNSMVINSAIISGATHLYQSQVCRDACIIGKDFISEATIDRRYPEYRYSLENKKFRLIPLSGEYEGMYRLQAKRDIDNYQAPEPIEKGDLGGIVSGPYNLSLNGECWIDYDSVVQGLAGVYDYAYVGESFVYGNSVVCSSAQILGCTLYQNCYIGGKARIINSQLADNTRVFGSARIESPNNMMYYKNKDDTSELNLSCSFDVENQVKTIPVQSKI